MSYKIQKLLNKREYGQKKPQGQGASCCEQRVDNPQDLECV
jgi:hypothetical protein